jgi:hypothetical protein
MHDGGLRERTAETSVVGVVSEENGIIAGICRLASGTRHIGLGIINAAQLSSVTIETVDGAM